MAELGKTLFVRLIVTATIGILLVSDSVAQSQAQTQLQLMLQSRPINDSSCNQDQSFVFSSIVVQGNQRTSLEVILRELGIPLEQVVCSSEIEVAILRLKRIGIFAQVESEVQNSDDSKHILTVKVIEKWTTIPILKVNSGGGTSQYTLGVYDPNIFGAYLETGVQYENLGGASSGVLWFKNPRLFGQRQGIDLQLWSTKRIRIKYDQESPGPEIKRGFLHEREKLYFDYYRELASSLVLRFSLDLNKDRFSTRFLSQELLDKLGPNPDLPPPTELLIFKLAAEIGEIIDEAQQLEGIKVDARLSYAQPTDGVTSSFLQGEIELNYYQRLSDRWQFAQRFLSGSTSTKVLQYWYYLGGLDRIRGFVDNRFAGRQFVLSNSELRFLLLQKPHFLLQGVSFIDLAAVGEEAEDLTRARAASLGGGLRAILPKLYRVVLRVDYAQPILKKDAVSLSLGVQQFF